MNRFISADWIYPVSEAPIKQGVVEVQADGTIVALYTKEKAELAQLSQVEHYQGVIIPGLINTHCHLELAHMRGKLTTGTGLTHFIKGVLANRIASAEVVQQAMQQADQEMLDNGIVAVGDISNAIDSKMVKLSSGLYYQTFVEVFGFNSPSETTITAGIALKEQFEPLPASIVPHAPYSVSSSLFAALHQITASTDILSIHNQETQGENELFENGTGKFADFFADLGIAQNENHNNGEKSINYHLPRLKAEVNTLLVHNTFTDKTDLDFAKQTHHHLYWCLCPNANQYIEGTLPDVDLFRKEDVTITLGTDSLASNHQLSILAEMYTLQVHKHIPFEESLKWATLNGAQFLKIDQQYGSLTLGKKPGLVLVGLTEEGLLEGDTTVKRLI